MIIDWSKAPEGAEGAMVAQFGNSIIAKGVVEFVPREGWDRSRYVEGPDDWLYFEKPTVWSGEGLPPVGTVCELRKKNGGWGPAIIKYMSNTICVWLWDHGNPDQREWSCEPYNMEFRPIRTPEQIAEQEKIAGLNEMIMHMKDHPSGTHGATHIQEILIHEDVARDLWAAGYRKQEQP